MIEYDILSETGKSEKSNIVLIEAIMTKLFFFCGPGNNRELFKEALPQRAVTND